jgi:hypothetical protein
MVDLAFLTSQECGKTNTNLSRSQFGKAERTAASTRICHSQSTFLSAKVINGTSHIAIPVNTIESQIKMSIKQKHGRFLWKAGRGREILIAEDYHAGHRA